MANYKIINDCIAYSITARHWALHTTQHRRLTQCDYCKRKTGPRWRWWSWCMPAIWSVGKLLQVHLVASGRESERHKIEINMHEIYRQWTPACYSNSVKRRDETDRERERERCNSIQFGKSKSIDASRIRFVCWSGWCVWVQNVCSVKFTKSQWLCSCPLFMIVGFYFLRTHRTSHLAPHTKLKLIKFLLSHTSFIIIFLFGCVCVMDGERRNGWWSFLTFFRSFPRSPFPHDSETIEWIFLVFITFASSKHVLQKARESSFIWVCVRVWQLWQWHEGTHNIANLSFTFKLPKFSNLFNSIVCRCGVVVWNAKRNEEKVERTSATYCYCWRWRWRWWHCCYDCRYDRWQMEQEYKTLRCNTQFELYDTRRRLPNEIDENCIYCWVTNDTHFESKEKHVTTHQTTKFVIVNRHMWTNNANAHESRRKERKKKKNEN